MKRPLLFFATLALLVGCESGPKTQTSESERRAREAAARAASHLEGATASAVNEAERAANAAQTQTEAAAATAAYDAERAMHTAKARFEGTFASAERHAVHDRFTREGLAPGGRLGPSETGAHAARSTREPGVSASASTSRTTHAAPPLATTSARITTPSGVPSTPTGRGSSRHIVETPTLTLSPIRGAENASGVANAYPAAPEWTVSPPRAVAPGEATIDTGGPAVAATPSNDAVTTPRNTRGQ